MQIKHALTLLAAAAIWMPTQSSAQVMHTGCPQPDALSLEMLSELVESLNWEAYSVERPEWLRPLSPLSDEETQQVCDRIRPNAPPDGISNVISMAETDRFYVVLSIAEAPDPNSRMISTALTSVGLYTADGNRIYAMAW